MVTGTTPEVAPRDDPRPRQERARGALSHCRAVFSQSPLSQWSLRQSPMGVKTGQSQRLWTSLPSLPSPWSVSKLQVNSFPQGALVSSSRASKTLPSPRIQLSKHGLCLVGVCLPLTSSLLPSSSVRIRVSLILWFTLFLFVKSQSWKGAFKDSWAASPFNQIKGTSNQKRRKKDSRHDLEKQ